MSKTWLPELAVGTELARSLVEKQFPELRPACVRELAAGWDNTAFLVNDAWVFRFPRRAIAVDLIRTEAAALPELASRLSIEVPVPRWLGEPDEEYPWPFLGYGLIPGRDACRADLDDAARTRLAQPLAGFLRQLHTIPSRVADDLRLPPDRLRRLAISTRRGLIRERLDALVDGRVIESGTSWLELLDVLPDGHVAGKETVVHGDLYACHLLLSEDGALGGVIDWGDVHLGHPAVDLSVAHSFLPVPARATFRREYGGVDEEVWQLARARALSTAVAVTAYASDNEDRVLLREGLFAMRSVLS